MISTVLVGSGAGAAAGAVDGISGVSIGQAAAALAAVPSFEVGDIVRGSAQGRTGTGVVVAVSGSGDGAPKYSLYQVVSGKEGWEVRRFVNGRVTVDGLSFAATSPGLVAHVSLEDVTVTDPDADNGGARYAGRSLAEAMRGVSAEADPVISLPAPAPAAAPVATPTVTATPGAAGAPAADPTPPPTGAPASVPEAVIPAPTAEVPDLRPSPEEVFGQRRYVIGAVPENPPVGISGTVAPVASAKTKSAASRFRAAGGLKPPSARFQRWSPLERWQAAQQR